MRLSATRLTSIAQAGGQRTLIQRAISVLRRYGQDAHIYLPGAGMLNGLTAANYLDSAGTTQGTVDQPVGLVLDAAGGLGVELAPSLASATGWTLQQPTSGSVAVSGGAMTINSADGTLAFAQIGVSNATPGSTYAFSLTVSSNAGTGVAVQIGNSSSAAYTTPGTYTGFIVAIGATAFMVKRAGGITNTVATAFSVREVTGIAASQPTTSAKPILRRGAVNLLTYSGDFSNAVWFKTGAGAITYNEVGPSGAANSAATITTTTTVVRGIIRASGNYVVGSANMPLTAAMYIKKTTGVLSRYPIFAIEEVTANRLLCISTVDTTNGLLTNWSAYTSFTINSGYASSIVSVGDYWLVAISGFASGVTNCSIEVYPVGAPTSTQSSGVITGAIGPDVVVGTCCMFQGTYTAAQIQALGGIPTTTTAPASTALGPQYWAFDGSNDSLSLGGPLFQMADDHCVVAGAISESATGDRAIFSQRSSAATNPIVCGVDVSSGIPRAIWRDDVGLISILSGTVVSGAIILSARSVANARVFRVNAVQKQAATLSLGSTAISSASIGVSPAASPVAYFSGAIYPVIAIKGTVPDADLLLLEKFVANLSGVTL